MGNSIDEDPTGAEQVPRLFGILNLVLGFFFSIGSLCCGIYTIALPVGLEFAQSKAQEKLSDPGVEVREAQIKDLRTRIAETTEEGARARLISERIDLEVAGISKEDPALDLGTFGAASPEVAGVLGVDLFAGLLLNLVMMVSGIGLLWLKGWGRILALIVAWSRLLLVGAVTAALIGVTGPALARGVSAQLEKWEQGADEAVAPPPAAEAENPAPAEPPVAAASPQEMGRQIRSAITFHALGSLLFTAAYPLFTIFSLTRPPVKALFRRAREARDA